MLKTSGDHLKEVMRKDLGVEVQIYEPGRFAETCRANKCALAPLDRRPSERTRIWANDPEIMRVMDRASVVGEAEHEAWFSSLAGQEDRTYFAIEAVG